MREKDLRDALEAWLDSHSGDHRIWSTLVGSLIKTRLLAKGNFKNAPRGKPTFLNLKAKRPEARPQGGLRLGVSGASKKIMPWEKEEET